MIRQRLLSAQVLAGVALFAAAMGLYLSTLAPTLTWGWRDLGVDGGELLAAAYTLGVPHPPGYPTYTLLLKIFGTVVPIGDFAYRGNLFSAVAAAGSVVLLYLAIVRITRHLKPDASVPTTLAAAFLGGITLATAPLFWSQAVITEVYALNSLFIAALLLLATHLVLRPSTERERDWRHVSYKLGAFALLLGLGLGNHLTLLAVAVPLIYWIGATLGWRKLLSPWTVGGLLLGLAIYIYLPVRAAQNPDINWGNASTAGGVAWMLSGRPYQDYVFGTPAQDIPDRLLAWLDLTFVQFNPLGLFLGLLGAKALSGRVPKFAIAAAASMALITAYTLTYGTRDYRVFMIPAYLLFSVWIGVGFFWLLTDGIGKVLADRRLSPNLRGWLEAIRPAFWATLVVFVAIPAVSVMLNRGSQDLSDDRAAYKYARNVIDAVPDGSVILSGTEATVFSLWYMRYVEDRDADVAVFAVPLLQYDWYIDGMRRQFPNRVPSDLTRDVQRALRQIIDHNAVGRSVYLTYDDKVLAKEYAVEFQEPGVFEVRSP